MFKEEKKVQPIMSKVTNKLIFVSTFMLFLFISFFISKNSAYAAPSISLDDTGSTVEYYTGNPTPYNFETTFSDPTTDYTNVTFELEGPINFDVSTVTGTVSGSPITFNVTKLGNIYTLTPSPALANLPANTTVIINNQLKLTCPVSTGTFKSRMKSNGVTISEAFKNLDVLTGILNVSLSPVSSTLFVDDTLTWTVTLSNNGLGTLFDARVTDTLDSDLTIQSVNTTDLGVTVAYAGQLVTANVTSLEKETVKKFTVTAKVTGCNSANHVVKSFWPSSGSVVCDDLSGLPGVGVNSNDIQNEGSVNVVEKTPKLTYTINGSTLPSLAMNWKTKSTVTVDVTNAGLGTARNIYIASGINNGTVTINNIVGAGWSYNSGTSQFVYANPVIPSGITSFTFDITPKQSCPAPGNSPVVTSGTINWDFNYTSDCGTDLASPVSTTSYTNVALVPSFSVTQVAAFPDPHLVNLGDPGIFILSPTITNSTLFTNPITVTHTIDSGFSISGAPYTTPVAAIGNVVVSGQTVTWTFDPASLAANPSLQLNIPIFVSTDPCVANTYQGSTLGYIANTTTASCGITGGDYGQIFINDSQPDSENNAGVEQNRSIIAPAATVDGYEVCDPNDVTLQTEYIFGSTFSGNYSTAIFKEPLNNSAQYVAGSAKYDLDTGSGYSGIFTNIPLLDISTASGLVINLSSVNAGGPMKNTKIKIQFKLYYPVVGSLPVTNTQELTVTSAPNCSGYGTVSHYYRTLEYKISNPAITMSFTGPSSINDCADPFPVTLNVNKNTFKPLQNVKLTLDETNFEIIAPNPVTDITYSGFTANPTTSTPVGAIRTFDFGTNDLTTAGTITFMVQKKCGFDGGIPATSSWENICSDTLTGSAAYNPTLKKSKLSVKVSKPVPPIDVDVDWTITINNTGSGDALNVDLVEKLGVNLKYSSYSVISKPAVTNIVTGPVSPSSIKGKGITDPLDLLHWTIDKIPAYESVEIKVNGNIISDNNLAIQCGSDTVTRTIVQNTCLYGTSCMTPASYDTPSILLPASKVTTTLITPKAANLCSNVPVKIQLINGGKTRLFNAQNVTTLPSELCYVTGTGMISKNGGAPIAFEPARDATDRILTWKFGGSSPNNILNQLNGIVDPTADKIEITFDAKVSCTATGSFVISSATNIAKPCELDLFAPLGAGTGGTGAQIGPTGSATVAVDLPILSSVFTDVNISNGETKTWTLDLTNNGKAIAQNVGATFTLPNNLVLDTDTSADTSPPFSSYNSLTRVITWDPGTIGTTLPPHIIAANGGTAQITVKARLKDALACDPLTTQIQGDITFGCPTSASAVPGTCNSSCSANPPYHVTSGVISTPTITNVTFAPNIINSCGTSSDMSITFNTNQTSAKNVNITDTLPIGYEYDSAVSITGTSSRTLSTSPAAGNTSPIWIFSDIGTGTTTITFKIRPIASGSCPDGSGSPSNEISISYANTCSELIPTPVTKSTTMIINKPIVDLNPAKSTISYFSTPTNTTTKIILDNQPGIDWEISFKNTGSAPLTNTTVKSVIGNSFDTVAGVLSSNLETPVDAGNTATWTISSLAAGATWTAHVTAKHIGSHSTTGLTNTVTIDGGCATGCKHQTTLAGGLPYSHTTYVSLLDTTDKVMGLSKATIGDVFPVTLTSSFSGNGIGAYTNVLIKDVFPKDVAGKPLMKINSAPILKEKDSLGVVTDQTANWDYTPPSSPDWTARWSPKATYTFNTPSTVTIEFDAYVNDATPGSGVMSSPSTTNSPKDGDPLINQNLTTYTFQGNNYTQSKDATLTVYEPKLIKTKAIKKLTVVADGVATIDTSQTGRGGASPNTLVGGGELVGYTITLSNTSISTDPIAGKAYDIQLSDVIPVGMRANTPVLVSAKLDGSDVLSNSNFDTSTVATDGKIKINFLTTTGIPGFPGIPAGKDLVITYYCKVDSNITGSMTMTNSLYLAKDSTSTARGDEGYSSLPSNDPDNALDRIYGDTTASTQTVKTPADAIKITKSQVTEITESGNAANNQATPGEKITYTVVLSTVDTSTLLGLKVSALAPLAAPFNSFRDIIPDGIDVDQTNSSIVLNSGTINGLAVAPSLSYLLDTPSAGKTTVSIPDLTLDPDTTITITIVGMLKDKYASGSSVTKAQTIKNGGNGTATAPNSTSTLTDFRWADSSGNNQDTYSNVVTTTVVEPTVTLTNKVKVLPVSSNVVPGDTVTYRITFNNANPNTSAAHGVTIIDTLPIGMRVTSPTFISESTPANSKKYDPATGKITWFWNTINRNTTVNVNYSAKVDDTVSTCTQLVNEAQIGSYSNLDLTNSADPIDPNGLLPYRKLYSPTTSFKVPVSIGELAMNPVHNMTGTPGSVVIMPHTINTCISGTIIINNPVSTRGWPVTVYQDLSTNHDGSVLSSTPLTSIAAVAGTPIYVAIKEQIPHDIASSTVDNVTLSISQTVVGIASALTASVTDTVNASLDPNLAPAGAGTLKLVKTVDKAKADPGDTVTYTIDYTNAGTEDIDGIVIEDITPEGTHLAAAGASFVTGAGSVTKPLVGEKGPISWTVTGSLKAGQSGQVTFSVVIE